MLADHERLPADLQRSIPGLTPDPDLQRDLEMLAEYRAVLEASTNSQRQLLSDSLMFASLVKVRPRPAW
ncbi:MAG: hypothetical protein V3T05_10085 [Myxococcota bacterium]